MKRYDDHLEKIVTAIFGILGILAVLINLHIKGYGISEVLDAIKDLAKLVVVITVFLVTSKLFRRDKQFDFHREFEDHLKDWIYENDYLISEEFEGTGKGKLATKSCYMIIDHSNFVTQKKLVKAAAHNKEKATFVRLPQNNEDKNEFEVRLNSRTFERQSAYRKENEVDINAILDQFSKRINDKFGNLVEAKADKGNKAILVSYENIDKTKENARKLVDIIEFTKTMILALA